jgi:hypothetical protein
MMLFLDLRESDAIQLDLHSLNKRLAISDLPQVYWLYDTYFVRIVNLVLDSNTTAR